MRSQPPSGGCVLKLDYIKTNYFAMPPAAFGRLCVETKLRNKVHFLNHPAAFGRLCVETDN